MPNPTPPAEVDVAEGERLLASVAAPRPWRQSLTDDTMILTMDSREVAAIDGDYNSPDEWPVMEANAALIVFAVNNLPALLRAASERDAAVREAERLREAMLSTATRCVRTPVNPPPVRRSREERNIDALHNYRG